MSSVLRAFQVLCHLILMPYESDIIIFQSDIIITDEEAETSMVSYQRSHSKWQSKSWNPGSLVPDATYNHYAMVPPSTSLVKGWKSQYPFS